MSTFWSLHNSVPTDQLKSLFQQHNRPWPRHWKSAYSSLLADMQDKVTPPFTYDKVNAFLTGLNNPDSEPTAEHNDQSDDSFDDFIRDQGRPTAPEPEPIPTPEPDNNSEPHSGSEPVHEPTTENAQLQQENERLRQIIDEQQQHIDALMNIPASTTPIQISHNERQIRRERKMERHESLVSTISDVTGGIIGNISPEMPDEQRLYIETHIVDSTSRTNIDTLHNYLHTDDHTRKYIPFFVPHDITKFNKCIQDSCPNDLSFRTARK